MEGAPSGELVILGLLKRQPAHGYELLRQVRIRRMSEYIHLAPSGMYRALARLEDQGCVTARSERAGNRPERQTYAITGKGEARLQELLYEHLHSQVQNYDPLNAALTFGDLAPRRAVVNELRRRREMVAGEREEAEQILAQASARSALLFGGLVVERWVEHLGAEFRWLGKAIGQLEGPVTKQPGARKEEGDEHRSTSG